MATEDDNGIEIIEDEELEDDVESPEEEDDEIEDEDSEGEDDGDEEEDDESEGDDTEDDDEEAPEEPKFEKRYTQLKGETLEEYVKSVETAYHESSTEAVRAVQELKDLKTKVGKVLVAAEKDPELAKAIGLTEEDTKDAKAETVQKSPAESYAEQMMNERMEQEYSDFTKEHPEVDTDQVVREELLAEVGLQSDAYFKKHGKVISMAEALNRSWKVLGYDDNKKEELAVAAKKVASQSKSTGTSSKKTKSKGKTEVSSKAMEIAKKMGLSEKDVAKYYSPE